MKITKAFIESTTGVLKVQSTLKRSESIQLARVVNKLQSTGTILISKPYKTGQAGDIQDPQRHLSSKHCRMQSSNLLLCSLNHDVLISKANEKRWNVGWLGGASQTQREGARPNLRAPISPFPCAAPWEICSHYYFSSYCLCSFNILFSH